MSEAKRYKYHRVFDGYNFLSAQGEMEQIVGSDMELVSAEGYDALEADNAALRLKVQGLDRTLADVYAQRDGLQRDLTTLETLVNAVHHELVALFPQPKDPTLDDARAICGNKNKADAQCLYNAYNALLTHRQGMGG